jgi:hypothetical protein
MKALRIRFGLGALLIASCLVITACPNNDQVKTAADAVNRYGTTLSSLQDAEIQLHSAGKVPDAIHAKILQSEIIAAKTGHALDAGISVASKGNDPSAYIDAAKGSFDDLLSAINLDPNTKQGLELAANAANSALQNAVTLIQQLKASKPSPATPAPAAPASTPTTPAPSGSAIWLLFAIGFFPMMAAAGVEITQVVSLLNLAVQLEPVAFDLVMKLTTSLKGKTTEEVLAMNEAIFSKIEATAQAELNKQVPPTP